MAIRIVPALILAAATSSWFASKVSTRAAAVVELPAPAIDDTPRQRLAGWLRARLPPGGRVDDMAERGIEVVHTVAAGETALTIARAHVHLTDVYRAKDLAALIAHEQGDIRPGMEVRIPHLVVAPPPSPDEDRMRWPTDRTLRGIYITGETAGASWPEVVDRVKTHGLNAIVLDAKAYGGDITYSTHVQRALASGAGSSPPIRDFSRAVRFAHARGIYVIARVTCFHDPWMAAHEPRLALGSTGWLDPANEQAQDYLVDVIKEVVEQGADEVQLDYVRFPVQDVGGAVIVPPDGHRTRAIRSFVARAHEVTAARHVPLSLDVFGIAASGSRQDIEKLGQNLVVLGPECEAISPMVYPSHYPVGTFGFDQPGDHPELVGFGTQAAVAKLHGGNADGTVVRPWLQAAPFRTSQFGPKYIQDEIRNAEANGAVGWLLWDAGNSYWAVWKALPVVRDAPFSRLPPPKSQ